jgi:hypothetical protein
LYEFGIPVSFSSFFLGYLARFYPKLVETTTNSTNAKPVNFTRRTIENCFVPLVYSVLLSGKICILKALWFCLYFWLKSSDEEGEKQRRSKAVPQITACALLRHNARALANQIFCYITLIL